MKPLYSVALILISMVFVFSCGKKEMQPSVQTNEQNMAPNHIIGMDSLEMGSDSTAYLIHQSVKPKNAAVDTLKLKDFKYTWSDSRQIPPVIIVVDDFGYATGDLLQGFVDLPKEIAFAVLPDLPYTVKSGKMAQAGGHDVLIHCPMEAKIAKTSPGKRYLKPGQDPETVKTMIDDFYAQLPMAVGLNNHMGSTATPDRELMKTVLDHLGAKGLLFLDSSTTPKTVGYKLAHTLGYKAIKCNFFLDVPDNSNATLAAHISRLGNFRGRVEPVVIITHCHNHTKLNALKSFIGQIQEMGVKLTSISSYYGSNVALIR